MNLQYEEIYKESKMVELDIDEFKIALT